MKTKPTILILILLAIAITATVLMSDTKKVDGAYCFARVQAATDDAPYAVEEHINFTIQGEDVAGEKIGTQKGPDMTNGYTGTFVGKIVENEIEGIYSYTIEGSNQKELELYFLGADTLIKKRWKLHDEKQNGVTILMPDYEGEPTLIEYTKEEC